MSTLPIGGRRWAASSPRDINGTGSGERSEQEPNWNDFLAVLTHATSLYSQHGVYDMQMVDQSKTPIRLIYGRGAIGQVSAANADIAQPSTLYSTQVDNRTVDYVIKQYPDGIWNLHGEAMNSAEAACFMAELRVLSNPVVRNSGKIVKILGLAWTPEKKTGILKPMIMLERADFSLSELLDQSHRHPSLSLETKLQLALDIAHGIWTLHSCGIVHGDIKPANILISGSRGNYRAKLADFSHAVYPSTGKADPLAHLPGGTRIYAAPESQDPAPVSRLKLTDVYSFGLVFACLMVGKEIFSQADVADVDRQKRNGTLLQHLHRLILSINDASLSGLPALCEILKLTVQPVPDDRDLAKTIAIISREIGAPLTFPARGGELEDEAPASRLGPSQLSVPYQSLLRMPGKLQRHVVGALEHIANKDNDLRTAAAAFELGVCYSSGLGIQRRLKHDDRQRQDSTIRWLVRAAELGDDRARLSLTPIFESYGADLPSNLPITEWLQDLVQTHGDTLALEQLFRISPSLGKTASEAYQCRHYAATDCVLVDQPSLDLVGNPFKPLRRNGDTILHFFAATGNLEKILAMKANNPVVFRDLIKEANSVGDTALIQATRGGHAEVVVALVDAGADAAVHNLWHETALHHLVNIDSKVVREVAFKLARAGALPHLHLAASGAGSAGLFGLEVPGPASAALRAVYRDSPSTLRALFDVEAELAPERQTGRAQLSDLLEAALKFHCRKVLPVLDELIGLEMDTLINSRQFWQENRYSTPFETCVFGPVSAIPASGYNYPEQFIRRVRSGRQYLRGLATCIDFLLRHGARVRESGIVDFLFRHSRRDAMFLLALREVGSLRWARLAIASDDSDMLYAILLASLNSGRGISGADAQVNYPLLFASMMLARGVDTVSPEHFLGWVKRSYGSGQVDWVPSGPDEMGALQKLGGFSDPTTELMPLYVAAARQRLDWVKALLALGASLQDSISPGQTVLRLLLSTTRMSPRNLSAILKSCISCRSKHIITFADVACLLDAHHYENPPSTSYRLKERKGVVYCIPLGHVMTESGAGCISFENLDDIRTLWTYIAKANRFQSRRLEFPGPDDDDEEDLPNLMVFAALRSNWAAVRFLLDIGFPPDGTGFLFEGSRLRNLPMTPLDVVQWTSYIREPRGGGRVFRDRRASNRQIANLLLENDASHSAAFGSVYHLVVPTVGDVLFTAWRPLLFDATDTIYWLILLLVSLAAWTILALLALEYRNLLREDGHGFILVVFDVFHVSLFLLYPLASLLAPLFLGSLSLLKLLHCVYGGDFKVAFRMVYERSRQSAWDRLRPFLPANASARENDTLLGAEDDGRFQREYNNIFLSPCATVEDERIGAEW